MASISDAVFAYFRNMQVEKSTTRHGLIYAEIYADILPLHVLPLSLLAPAWTRKAIEKPVTGQQST